MNYGILAAVVLGVAASRMALLESANADRIDWVKYYKEFGYVPNFVRPTQQWGVPDRSLIGPAVPLVPPALPPGMEKHW